MRLIKIATRLIKIATGLIKIATGLIDIVANSIEIAAKLIEFVVRPIEFAANSISFALKPIRPGAKRIGFAPGRVRVETVLMSFRLPSCRALGRVCEGGRVFVGGGEPGEARALGREAHPVVALFGVADEGALPLLQVLEGADDVGVGDFGRRVEYLAGEYARLATAPEEAEHVILDEREQSLVHLFKTLSGRARERAVEVDGLQARSPVGQRLSPTRRGCSARP